MNVLNVITALNLLEVQIKKLPIEDRISAREAVSMILRELRKGQHEHTDHQILDDGQCVCEAKDGEITSSII